MRQYSSRADISKVECSGWVPSTLLPSKWITRSVSRRPRAVSRNYSSVLRQHTAKFISGKPIPEKNSAKHDSAEVHLVGIGPGDPALLTIRALEVIQRADVLLYDRLGSADVLKFARSDAEKISVGKGRGLGTGSQGSIQSELVRHARAGRRVVRLKGGDPFIFGRGGEEVQYLAKCGVHVEIVPGVTAASGVCASLGIPLIDGVSSNAVQFLTGHLKDSIDVNREAGHEDMTYVIYMGLQELSAIVNTLKARGVSSTTPAAAVEAGTMPEQRVVWAKMGDLPQVVQNEELKSPTLVIIGNVVRLAYGWPAELKC